MRIGVNDSDEEDEDPFQQSYQVSFDLPGDLIISSLT